MLKIKKKQNQKTEKLIKSENGHEIHEISTKGEGDYGMKKL